ncbi:phage gp6-like head-tail connector protein, partial [Candidatus Pacearchaeota archaeon]|nr:phage gp6-like head-tail connector protein [Candidatus Pacearchaeota archaeon]
HIYYDCGWPDPENVPAMLKVAILLVASDMYENREPTLIGVSAQTLKTLDRILDDYIDWTWKV